MSSDQSTQRIQLQIELADLMKFYQRIIDMSPEGSPAWLTASGGVAALGKAIAAMNRVPA